jgi:phosphoribosylaminoimidazole-succinocarboxamide synthase
VRDWLESVEVDGMPWNKKPPPPSLSAEIISVTSERYREAMRRLLLD